MFDIKTLFKRKGNQKKLASKQAAKERLHLVLMQDRANVSADFLDMMKAEIINVIKKYIEVEGNDIDVKLINKQNEDGTIGGPTLYANIPIIAIKDDYKEDAKKEDSKKAKKEENKEVKKEDSKEIKKENEKEENKKKISNNNKNNFNNNKAKKPINNKNNNNKSKKSKK